jgi:transposase
MITADTRKAVFLLHQEGTSIRQISRQLRLSRNAVRRIIAQSGQMPQSTRGPSLILDQQLLRDLHQECNGYAQRMMEILREEHGIAVKYSTLTRHLRDLGITAPVSQRCERVPDQPGAEMQHDTSPFKVLVGSEWLRLQASLLYLRYSKRRYLQFYPVFDRFHMKCFLHLGLMHWGYAPRICVIDNTNLARWRGLGSNAVMVPEMEAFGRAYGFRFLCHAPKHPDRKAGEERSFLTVETNFIPGRSFQSLEDLNRQALEWSTVRMEQRPQGKAGLIPAQAFEHERAFLTQLPRHLPAPYLLLERTVDEYGYVAVDGNYYEVPGSGRGNIQVLRYLHHLVLCRDRRTLIEYALPPWGVKNQPFHAPRSEAALSPTQPEALQPGRRKAPACG